MKKRIISAVIALLIASPLVYLGKWPFYIFVIILALIGYREIIKLFVKTISIRIAGYLCLVGFILSNVYKTDFTGLLDAKLIIIIFFIFALIALAHNKEKDFQVNHCFYLFGITLFLGMAFSSFIIIRNINLSYLIYLFILTILTDTFAQTTGMLFGKHKLSEISPNKTWEGCLGGTFFGTLFASLFYVIIVNGDINILLLVLITLVLSIIDQLGDLFFSLIKRKYNIKDFSNLMPGHGGILDRFDSAIFVALALVCLITFL